jgi:hypothetical protein
MDFDTFDTDLWNEIQDAPGEIFDLEDYWNDVAWDDDQALEEFSLECAFGPEE